MKVSNQNRIFISHGLAETGFAQNLAKVLEEKGLTVVEPAEHMLHSDNFAASLASALKSADGMVVILTRNSANSPWLRKEVQYALGHRRFKDKVVPIIRGNPESYPWILRHMKPITFEDDMEAAASKIAKRFAHSTVENKKSEKRRPISSPVHA